MKRILKNKKLEKTKPIFERSYLWHDLVEFWNMKYDSFEGISTVKIFQFRTSNTKLRSGSRKYKKLSVAILLVLVQCVKHTQSMKSILSF